MSRPRLLRLFAAPACSALLCLALISVAKQPARAQETYSQELLNPANEAVLDVVIVPPGHGQLFNDNGVLGGNDPNEATPFNSYLRSIERAVKDWDRAIDGIGAPWLSNAVVFNTYVVGRDVIPANVLADIEILITNEESKGIILGLALVSRPTCVNFNSAWFIKYFSPEDYYNVSAHEFGHCLGIGHVIGDKPPDDLMSPTYKKPIGARGNSLSCISTLNMRAVEASFRFLTGQRPPSGSETVSVPTSGYSRVDCGTLAAPGSQPPPSPSPSPSSNPNPQSSPTSSPSPSPSASPASEPEREEHARWLGIKLSKHLVVAGGLAAEGGDEGCSAFAPVIVERRFSTEWRRIATATTNADGLFRKKVRDRPGRYRVSVPEQSTDSAICLAATSRVLRHRH
jgi:hypothetical protein